MGPGEFGYSVSLSANGTTALVGGFADNGNAGAAWIFTQSGGSWVQDGAKLVADCASSCANEGTGESGQGEFGKRVALDGAGDLALVGAPADNSGVGAAWVFAPSGGAWSQQSELTGSGESGAAQFGFSVALSSDGSTALVGGPFNAGGAGAAWAFAQSGGSWSPSAELTGSGANGSADFGASVALDATGDMALIGGYGDGGGAGAAWAFGRSGASWSQQGSKLVGDCASSCVTQGTGESGYGDFGVSVAVSAGGSTALVGAPFDAADTGAAWLFAAAAYPPTVSVAAPQNGASYSQGAVVDASFACQPGAGGGVLDSGSAGCSGTVADGQPIDTSTPGTHTFTVTATDTDGQATTVSASYTVTGTSGGGSGGPGSGGGTIGSGGSGSGGSGASGSGGSGGSGSGRACGVSVAGVRASGTTALLSVSCAASGSRSRISLTLSAVETARATQARSKRGRKRKARSDRSTVVVGRSAASVAAGAHETVRISLSAAGRRLLSRQRSLRATLEVTVVEGGRTVVIARRTVVLLRQRPKKRHGGRAHHGRRRPARARRHRG